MKYDLRIPTDYTAAMTHTSAQKKKINWQPTLSFRFTLSVLMDQRESYITNRCVCVDVTNTASSSS